MSSGDSARGLRQWSASIDAMANSRSAMLPGSNTWPAGMQGTSLLGNPDGAASYHGQLWPYTAQNPLGAGVPYGGISPISTSLQQQSLLGPQPIGETSRQANPVAVQSVLAQPLVVEKLVNARFQVPATDALAFSVSTARLDAGKSAPGADYGRLSTLAPGSVLSPFGLDVAAHRSDRTLGYNRAPSRVAALAVMTMTTMEQINALLLAHEIVRYNAVVEKITAAGNDPDKRAAWDEFVNDTYGSFTPSRVGNGMFTLMGTSVSTTLAQQSGMGNSKGLVRNQTLTESGVVKCHDYTDGAGLCLGACFYTVLRRFKMTESPLYTWLADPDLTTKEAIKYRPQLPDGQTLYPLQYAIVSEPSGSVLDPAYRIYEGYTRTSPFGAAAAPPTDNGMHYDAVVKRVGRVFATYNEYANQMRMYTPPATPDTLQPVTDGYSPATLRNTFDLHLFPSL